MLASLVELSRVSQARLVVIQPLIPAHLRHAVQAGPIDGSAWCLLANSIAAAAKIRQLVPSLLAALVAQGWDVQTIRITVQNQPGRRS